MISKGISNGFKNHLRAERELSQNSIQAYLRDIKKFDEYMKIHYPNVTLQKVTLNHCEKFAQWLSELNISSSSQARTLSGLKTFFKYLLLEEIIDKDATYLLEAPKISQKIPSILTLEEVNKMLAIIDLSQTNGQRNKAIIEVLYGCGLRVSELINLKISNLHLDINFIKVEGKGKKERLVPINTSAIKQIKIYHKMVRAKAKIAIGFEDYLFLNKRGKKLSRVMIYLIVKELAQKAGITKKVSPHTFRHSFATHLYDGGADLRAIQEMLGHSSITTTEIYSKVSQQYLRDTLIEFHPRFNTFE